MKKAAEACAKVAQAMLPDAPESRRVLIVAGPGGNGGDGLFAGAHLALRGHTVHAVLSSGDAHSAARETFLAAGGQIVFDPEDRKSVVDAVAGVGCSRAASDDVLRVRARGNQART